MVLPKRQMLIEFDIYTICTKKLSQVLAMMRVFGFRRKIINFQLAQENIGLFAKIRPGEIFFFVHPAEKIINFLFFRNSHERSFNSCDELFLSKHCTIRAVIGMATMIHH